MHKKINNTFVDNAKHFYIIMPMYNLLDYSENCYMTLGSLWDYYRNETNHDENETDGHGNKVNNNKSTKTRSFKYKTKIIGNTPNNASRLNAELAVPLKYLSNFWRSLDLPLTNCEIELDLT